MLSTFAQIFKIFTVIFEGGIFIKLSEIFDSKYDRSLIMLREKRDFRPLLLQNLRPLKNANVISETKLILSEENTISYIMNNRILLGPFSFRSHSFMTSSI